MVVAAVARVPPSPEQGGLQGSWCCQALQGERQQWHAQYLCFHLHVAVKSAYLALQKLSFYSKREILKGQGEQTRKLKTSPGLGLRCSLCTSVAVPCASARLGML